MRNIYSGNCTRGVRSKAVAIGLATGTAIAVTCFIGIAPASAHMTVFAPPTAMYEAVPAPQAGRAWEGGYWAWQHDRYVWVPGHWTVAVHEAMAPLTPPPPVAQVMRLSADALFTFDRGDLTDVLPGGRADIREIADRLSRAPFGHIEVRGYTDRLGTPAYNQQLSQRRADTVKALLVQQGIPAGRIDARGFGQEDPVANCSDSQSRDRLVACLQPDRRVEIVAFARAGAHNESGLR